MRATGWYVTSCSGPYLTQRRTISSQRPSRFHLSFVDVNFGHAMSQYSNPGLLFYLLAFVLRQYFIGGHENDSSTDRPPQTRKRAALHPVAWPCTSHRLTSGTRWWVEYCFTLAREADNRLTTPKNDMPSQAGILPGTRRLCVSRTLGGRSF